MKDTTVVGILILGFFITIIAGIGFTSWEHVEKSKVVPIYDTIEFKAPKNTSIGEDLTAIKVCFPDAIGFRHTNDGYEILVPINTK
jgi:hypothetical protein